MAKLGGFALLLCSASALNLKLEEELHPLREVSPEEFHALNLRQEMEKGPDGPEAPVKKPKKKAKEEVKVPKAPWEIKEEKKKEALREHRANLRRQEREREAFELGNLTERNQKEEEMIQADANKKPTKINLKVEEKGFHLPWDSSEHKESHSSAAPKMSLIKEGKSLACTDGHKEILSFYISQMAGGLSSRQMLNREKCMREQLNQHCMPYESYPATVVEPCDDGDWTCANKRVLNDHATCLTKSVDWDAVQNYAKDSGMTKWSVLGSWCSHVKLLKEITNRIQLDEKFTKDYPALLVLEDHVILDREWAEEVTKDWVNNYKGQWDLVQLDTYGGKGLNRDKVGMFREKPIFRPSWHGQYNGFHAVLINTKSVPTLLERMQSLNVVPIEWLTKSLNSPASGLEVLSWEAGISTVSWEGGRTLKEKWMPNVPACELARTRKSQY